MLSGNPKAQAERHWPSESIQQITATDTAAANQQMDDIEKRLISIERKVRQLLYLACAGVAIYIARWLTNSFVGPEKDNSTWWFPVFFVLVVAGAGVLSKLTHADD